MLSKNTHGLLYTLIRVYILKGLSSKHSYSLPSESPVTASTDVRLVSSMLRSFSKEHVTPFLYTALHSMSYHRTFAWGLINYQENDRTKSFSVPTPLNPLPLHFCSKKGRSPMSIRKIWHSKL